MIFHKKETEKYELVARPGGRIYHPPLEQGQADALSGGGPDQADLTVASQTNGRVFATNNCLSQMERNKPCSDKRLNSIRVVPIPSLLSTTHCVIMKVPEVTYEVRLKVISNLHETTFSQKLS